MDIRPPIAPRFRLFERGGKAEELGLLTKARNELHPDGKAATALLKREGQAGWPVALNRAVNVSMGAKMFKQIIDRRPRCIEPMGIKGQGKAGIGRCQKDIKIRQEAGNLPRDDVVMLFRRH